MRVERSIQQDQLSSELFTGEGTARTSCKPAMPHPIPSELPRSSGILRCHSIHPRADTCTAGAFFKTATFETFMIRVSPHRFYSDPSVVLQLLHGFSRAQIRARQEALAAHAADFLYARNDSRVGLNFMEDATRRCLPRRRSCAAPASSA